MSFVTFPNEILLLILEKTPTTSIGKLGICCRRLSLLFIEQSLWKHKLISDFPQISLKPTETDFLGLYRWCRQVDTQLAEMDCWMHRNCLFELEDQDYLNLHQIIMDLGPQNLDKKDLVSAELEKKYDLGGHVESESESEIMIFEAKKFDIKRAFMRTFFPNPDLVKEIKAAERRQIEANKKVEGLKLELKKVEGLKLELKEALLEAQKAEIELLIID